MTPPPPRHSETDATPRPLIYHLLDLPQADPETPDRPVAPRRDMAFSRIESATDFLTTDWAELDNGKASQLRGILGMGTRNSGDGADTFMGRVGDERPDSSFSFALCDSGANVFWGPPPKHLHKGPMVYSLALNLDRSFTPDLAYIEVGKTRLPFGASDFGGLLFDTGTSITSFPAPVTQAIASETGRHGWRSQLSTDATCLSLPAHVTLENIDEVMPKLTLALKAGSLKAPDDFHKVNRITLPISNFFLVGKLHDGTTELCPWVFNGLDSVSDVGILGANAMIGHVLHFDEPNLRVGIAQGHNTCI